jgi:hypothetical protein
MRVRPVLLAALVVAALPASARADAVVEIDARDVGSKGPAIKYSGHVRGDAAGDELDVEVRPDAFTVRSSGGTLRAGAGCAAAGEREVRCAAPYGTVEVDGGDGDDRLRLAAGAAKVLGGPGDDVLEGGPGADELIGGGGRDVVRGGAGDDLLGDGDRSYRDRAPADADRLDGGPGADVVSYASRIDRVLVDLARPGVAGEEGEGDELVAIEGVDGGSAPDVLLGDPGPNVLRGGLGRGDEVRGRAGDDTVAGDLAVGGPGADRVGDGSYDAGARLDCGDGRDVAEPTEPTTLVESTCERVQLPEIGVATLPRPLRTFRAGVARLPYPCPADDRRSCRVSITLLTDPGDLTSDAPPGQRLGVASRRVAPGRRATTEVRFSRRGRRLIVAESALELRIVVTVQDESGGRMTQSFAAEVFSPDR